jgi:hypothetical protein
MSKINGRGRTLPLIRGQFANEFLVDPALGGEAELIVQDAGRQATRNLPVSRRASASSTSMSKQPLERSEQ